MSKSSPLLLLTFLFANLAAAADPGLLVTYQTGDQTDIVAEANLNAYVPAGQSATPFLPSGPLTITWNGFVKADLRGDYRFKVAARGTFELHINGKLVLKGKSDGGVIGPSEEIRLNKGPNKMTAKLSGAGDTYARLTWSEFGFLWEPIPNDMLEQAAATPGLASADLRRHGRELFLEGRCAKCHSVNLTAGVPELEMDAPSFAGIGTRRGVDWMAKWIADPQAERPSAQMPKLLHGTTAKADAAAIAAYLATLRGAVSTIKELDDADSISAGGELVSSLHCIGCHNLPGAKDADSGKIALDHLNEKFPVGDLASFLMNPTKHYQWRRMPNFNLSAEEAGQISGFLRSVSAGDPVASSAAASASAVAIESGRKLVQTTGCLNCHGGTDLPNEHRAATFATVVPRLANGCSAAKGNGPHYVIAERGLEALQAFAGHLDSLGRHVPTEFADRQSRNLNCRACHGELEGFPDYESLGGKLKPEWMHELFAGKIKDSPRPWLVHRMPSFPVIADALSSGLAMSHGYAPVTPAEPPIDPKRAEVGRTLTGVFGGFSCISCHGVGSMEPMQVFEAEGINLELPALRLQRDYYTRWLLNPLRIDPQSKMPVYFDEQGNSPLFDVYDGDTTKQLDAFWQYMRMGKGIKPPKMDGGF
jgi:mono/diheme cytochrome c family protein